MATGSLHGRARWRSWRGVALALTIVMLTMMAGPSAYAKDPPTGGNRPPVAPVPNSHVTAAQIIDALGLAAVNVTSVDSSTSDHACFNVFTTPAAGFPTQGNSYLVLSSGLVSGPSPVTGQGNTGFALDSPALDILADFDCVGLNTLRGNDLTRMTLVLTPPAGATFLSFQWKFFTEELPEVGTEFNDAFLVETPVSNFTISDDFTIVAPNNMVFDANGNQATVRAIAFLGLGEAAANAAGTVYDSATATHTTTFSFAAGTSSLTLVFSVMDIGLFPFPVPDVTFDSTVFLDNFVWSTAAAKAANLAVTKADAPDPVIAGGRVTYTIQVTNHGPDVATGVTLTDTLPEGAVLVSARFVKGTTQGTCSQAGGRVTCNLGNLANTASATATLVVALFNTAVAALVPVDNKASVTANETDPSPANNTATATTTRVNCAGTPPAAEGTTTTMLVGDVMMTVMVGRSGRDDQLMGTPGPDLIFGLGGKDKIESREGNDIVCGGLGDDLIQGSAGDDQIDGGPGKDRLEGGDGNDVLLGGADDDQLEGNRGDDLLDGGPGNDQLVGGAGMDTLSGSDGNDRLFGEDGDDRLDGGLGTDQLDGGLGTDTCTSQPGERVQRCEM